MDVRRAQGSSGSAKIMRGCVFELGQFARARMGPAECGAIRVKSSVERTCACCVLRGSVCVHVRVCACAGAHFVLLGIA